MIRTSTQKIFLKEYEMKLSNQAIGAMMVTLQKCLSEQSDMVELMKEWDLGVMNDEVIVLNPHSYKVDNPETTEQNTFITDTND